MPRHCPLHLHAGLLGSWLGGPPWGSACRAFLSLSPQALHDLGLGLLSGLHALTPWRYALKRIGGQFGSSVLSYFLFLKTLLAFNALLLLPLLAFLVGVQAAFPPAPRGPAPAFTGLELLTGGVRAEGGRRGAGGRPLLAPPPMGRRPSLPVLCLQAGSGVWEAPGWPRPSVDLPVTLAAPAGRGPLCLSTRPPQGAVPVSLEA